MRSSRLLLPMTVLCLVVSFVLQTYTVQAYTVSRYTWPGYSTTYKKDPSFTNVNPNFGPILDNIANEWNLSASPFDFNYNAGSANNVTFGVTGPGYPAITYTYTGSNNHWNFFELRISNAYSWYDGTQAPSLPSNYMDLKTVLRHELGHAMGLCHSSVSTNVMYYIVDKGMQRSIATDDTNGGSYLYWAPYSGPGPDTACNVGAPGSVPNLIDTTDDSSSYVSYGGRSDEWIPFSASVAIGSAITRTATTGGKSNITFQGDRISLIYSLDPSRGQGYVFVDDVYIDVINAYAPQTRRQVIRTWNVPYGTHKFEVRSIGGGTFDVDAFAANIASTGNGYYENNNPLFRYAETGAWDHLTGIVGTSGGNMSRTRYPGSIARFAFTGSSITYGFSKDISRGKAAITIDGVPTAVIDMYSPVLMRAQTLTFPVAYGTHVFHITNIGEKNPSATDFYIDIDWLQAQ